MRQLKLLALLTIALACGGWVVKETKSNTDMTFYVSPAGTPTAALTINGTSGAVINTGSTNIRGAEGAGTTTLTSSDKRVQVFTLNANTARVVQLPTTGIKAGEIWTMEQTTAVSDASGETKLTVQSSGANTIDIINQGQMILVALIDAPTTAANWRVMRYYSFLDHVSTFTFQGGTPGSASGNKDIVLSRLDSVVTCSIASTTTGTTGTSNTVFRSDTAFPTQYRPIAFNHDANPIPVKDNNATSTTVMGAWGPKTNGIVDIYLNVSATAWGNAHANSGTSDTIADAFTTVFDIKE